MTMNRLCTFAATALLLATSPSDALRPSAGCRGLPPTSTGETIAQSIEVDALVRTYRLHLPTVYDADTATPIVLAFHGYTGTAAGAEAVLGPALTPTHTALSRSIRKRPLSTVRAPQSPRGTTNPATHRPGWQVPFAPTTPIHILSRRNAARPTTAIGVPATMISLSSLRCSTRWNIPCASTATGSTPPV